LEHVGPTGSPLAVNRLYGDWVVYSPLIPLFLLLFTGLYMFVLPYAAARRGGQSVP
jgi:hypothetical protein